MTSPTFAVGLDAQTIVARGTPESALLTLPYEDPQHVQVVVAQRASSRPLDQQDARHLTSYFRWNSGASFWWQTLRPAVFSIERLTSDVWVGYLREPGELIEAGDNPHIRPNHEYLFAVSQTPSDVIVIDSNGPIFDLDRRGAAVAVYRANAAQIVRATFPTRGPNAVWVRMPIAARVRREHARALASELATFAVLRASNPGGVPEVLFEGRMELSTYNGEYVAYRPVPGSLLSPWLFQQPTWMASAASPRRVISEVLSEICGLIETAHSSGFCVGPLTPGLFRIRPTLDGLDFKLRSIPIALPGAGREGEEVPPSIESLYPTSDATLAASMIGRSYKRSRRRDAAAFGALARAMSDAVEIRDARLGDMADRLISGRERSIAFARLSLEQLSHDERR